MVKGANRERKKKKEMIEKTGEERWDELGFLKKWKFYYAFFMLFILSVMNHDST